MEENTIQIFDLEASLEQMEEDPTFWVFFGEENVSPGLHVKVDGRRQKKLADRYMKKRYTAQVGDDDEAVGSTEIDPRMVELAIMLLPDVIGWKNFKGEFSRDLVKRWWQKFPTYAEIFGSKFTVLLDAFQEKKMVYMIEWHKLLMPIKKSMELENT